MRRQQDDEPKMMPTTTLLGAILEAAFCLGELAESLRPML